MELRGLFHPNHSVVLPLFSFIGIGERSVLSSHVHIATLLPCAPVPPAHLLCGRCICIHTPRRRCRPSAFPLPVSESKPQCAYDPRKTMPHCVLSRNLLPVHSYAYPFCTCRRIHINPVASATLKTSYHHYAAMSTLQLYGALFIFEASHLCPTVWTVPCEGYPFISFHNNQFLLLQLKILAQKPLFLLITVYSCRL